MRRFLEWAMRPLSFVADGTATGSSSSGGVPDGARVINAGGDPRVVATGDDYRVTA